MSRISLRSLVLLIVLPVTAFAQAANVQYVYDALGRLTGVVDQQGNVATYSYDAVATSSRSAG